MLIVFEGIDGSGKDTQIRLLRAFLRQHRISHALHRYPTKEAKAAFEHLAGKKNVPAEELALVFAEDIVAEQKRVEREIAGGKVVICNRYLHSTIAYQGVGAGFAKMKMKLGKVKVREPDLVVLLDASPEISAQRKCEQKTPDRHERDVAFQSKVRRNYLLLARGNFLSYRYAVISAQDSPKEIFTHVLAHVEPLLIKRMGKRAGAGRIRKRE